jgi:chromosome segregation ATPase
MKDIQSDLSRLKKGIDEAKNNVAKLEGREQELLSQLKTDFKLDSIEAATKEVAKMKISIDKKEKEIQEQYDKLKEEFDW